MWHSGMNSRLLHFCKRRLCLAVQVKTFSVIYDKHKSQKHEESCQENFLTPWNSMIRQWPVISGSQSSPSPGTIWNDFCSLFLSKCYNLLKPGTAREARWIMPVAGPIDCSLELGLQGVEYPPPVLFTSWTGATPQRHAPCLLGDSIREANCL